MNAKLDFFFLFLIVITDFFGAISSFDSKCPALKVVQGRSKYRWRGRSVRFSCMRGFQLVGVKYAICLNGKWDADVPICVKYGCRAPSTGHVNGQFIESYRGAVVKIVCNPGYTLIGSPSVYCNGVSWNETFPVCRVKDSNPALLCDFEDSNLCGWSQDPMHDFDWKRRNGSTTSEDGPARNNTGYYYMYLESSGPRMENDAARLYSPVYGPAYSNGTCFKFWYLMHGPTAGFLKVYVKPEGVELSTLIPSFWIKGDQGKFWIESFFPIEPMESPFQIVIEGVRGPGAAGDTAFDDVGLTSAEECKILEMTSSTEYSSPSPSSSVNPDEDAIESAKCETLCGREKGNATLVEDGRCSCYNESCHRDGVCCRNQFELCFPFTSTDSTTQTDLRTSTSTPCPSTTPSEDVENEIPSPPSQHFHFNNESNDIIPIPPHPSDDRNENEIPKPETPPTASNATSPPTNPEIPIVTKEKSPKAETNKTKAATAANEIPRKETRPKAAGKTEGKSGTRSPAFSSTTARAFWNSKPNNIKLTFLEKPSSTNLSSEPRFSKGSSKEVSGKEPPQAIRIHKREEIVEAGIGAVVILVIVILGVVCYRRREHRKAERENMVEDSDSIVYEMDSSTLGCESHSLVCIRPGGLQQAR